MDTKAIQRHKMRQIEVNSSDRAFGFIVGGGLILFASARLIFGAHSTGAFNISLFAAAITLILAAIIAPRLLRPLNRGWMRLGGLLALITNPIIMAVIYIVTIVPTAAIKRLFRVDLLNLRGGRSRANWCERDQPSPPPGSMKNQH